MTPRVERDAHWAITSPDLFTLSNYSPSRAWYGALWQKRAKRAGWSAPAQGAGFRLGIYFESLWHHLLTEHPEYPLLDHNVRLEFEERTFGELDLLIGSESLEHWELAIKLYLCIGEPQLAQHWVGPNLHDSLKRKRDHLLEHQLLRSQNPAVKQRIRDQFGRPIQQVRAVIKGWAFYPIDATDSATESAEWMGPNHQQGWWATMDQLRARFKESPVRFAPMTKTLWLSPLTETDQMQGFTIEQLVKVLEGTYRPTLVATLDPRGNELERGFIVTDDWLGQAKSVVRLTS